MNLEIQAEQIPSWLPVTIITVEVAAFWTILSISAGPAYLVVPTEIRSIIQVITSLSNVVAALFILLAWPIWGLCFYATSVLLTGHDEPDLGNFIRAIGVAQVPMALGMFLVLILFSLPYGDIQVPERVLRIGGSEVRQYLETLPVLRVMRSIMTSTYVFSLFACVYAVRVLFSSSWIRAIASILLPISVYHLALRLYS